jgi:hypothetical protein
LVSAAATFPRRVSRNLDFHQIDRGRRKSYSKTTEAQVLAILYYTVAGIVLYLAADAILNRIEVRQGRRFEHRSLIFFFILLALALAAFQLIRHFLPGPPPQ